MTDREKTTELFLIAQGYEQNKIKQAISFLAGNSDEVIDVDQPPLTPKELCAVLKVSMTTLWRLNPPHMLVGARKRYQLEKVKQFLKQCQDGKQSQDSLLEEFT